jgi:hypothetical protein
MSTFFGQKKHHGYGAEIKNLSLCLDVCDSKFKGGIYIYDDFAFTTSKAVG